MYKIGTRVMDIEGEIYTVIDIKEDSYVLEDILGDRENEVQENEIVLYDSTYAKSFQDCAATLSGLEEKAIEILENREKLFGALKGKES